MTTAREILKALRSAWRAGWAQYHRQRDIQRRRRALMDTLPF